MLTRSVSQPTCSSTLEPGYSLVNGVCISIIAPPYDPGPPNPNSVSFHKIL